MDDTELTQDYRVQLVFRRRNEGAFRSYELKTENFYDDEQLLLEAVSLIQNTLEEDRDYLDERGNDD